ncbi:hypothetical protein HUA74_39495 [Myxococcus sp. CA051A]|uniref:hypothetical protein n=1 Tax=unclassified Myxococcus TaxID=2648731 RepID=UPI00157A97C0|nr:MULTISPECIES: hypothetical protein [unclassified Myxococcus]NTX17332.1 hypothetical protein [Myxococcus sp. CA056]NTX40272.1 hypothetical protein [Myxococcus sp. CA033]NTX52217.1 hypothetical protein [Myxococcus sp. CA039A]NTX66751.1 hypothetical protein [Myxococcus sp. CA051A]
MRTFLIGGLLAMAVGCGGPMEQEQEEESTLASEESPLPNCTNLPTSVTRYYNASLTAVIGERGCSCGSYVNWGRTSKYYNVRDNC